VGALGARVDGFATSVGVVLGRFVGEGAVATAGAVAVAPFVREGAPTGGTEGRREGDPGLETLGMISTAVRRAVTPARTPAVMELD
jgi:hypothetical protein